jgi:hypothetical protein
MDARVEATKEQLPMAGRGSVTQVTDSREPVRARTGRAIEEKHRKWFSSQALSRAARRLSLKDTR